MKVCSLSDKRINKEKVTVTNDKLFKNMKFRGQKTQARINKAD